MSYSLLEAAKIWLSATPDWLGLWLSQKWMPELDVAVSTFLVPWKGHWWINDNEGPSDAEPLLSLQIYCYVIHSNTSILFMISKKCKIQQQKLQKRLSSKRINTSRKYFPFCKAFVIQYIFSNSTFNVCVFWLNVPPSLQETADRNLFVQHCKIQ